MTAFGPVEIIEAELFARLPDELRKTRTYPEWGQANRPGIELHSFLEGPCFDRDGQLWVTDIPYGRVFSITPAGEWRLRFEYDGWPNGLKFDSDGLGHIADYKTGILRFDPKIDDPKIEPLVTQYQTEGFRGCNDLTITEDGLIYFTDQGQSGLHRPDGRVFAFDPSSGRLSCLLDNGPSPNGIVFNQKFHQVHVAMTRANGVWRLPLLADGSTTKVGLFVQLSGGLAGPDGLALDEEGGLWIAHAGLGCVWGCSPLGEIRWRVTTKRGHAVTNLAFDPKDPNMLFMTLSDTGEVLRARVPVRGETLPANQ